MVVEPSKLLDLALEHTKLDDNTGICLSCGQTQEGVEPDARKYTCENCGQDKVYGAEEVLLMYS